MRGAFPGWGVFVFLMIMGVAQALPAVESLNGDAPVSATIGRATTVVGESRAEPSPPGNALFQLNQRVDALQQEVENLRGLLEELQHRLAQVSTASVGAAAPAATSTGGGGNSSLATALKTGSSEKTLYDTAYGQLQSRDYEAAAQSLKQLIQQHPKGEYTANAAYWLGEVSLIQGHLEEAEKAFAMVYHQYPKHPKAGDALLKLGYVAHARGDVAQAKKLLTQVIQHYAGSASARLAQARLEKIKQEGH